MADRYTLQQLQDVQEITTATFSESFNNLVR
jgi:hypothetical protein